MTALIVPERTAISVPRYAVIGLYSEDESRFVRHVALTRDHNTVRYGNPIAVWEMGPPLVVGTATQSAWRVDPQCQAHLVGWISLTADERDGITDWLAEIDLQMRPRRHQIQYCASTDPEDEWHRDERGQPLYRLFSCVSFVTSAYLEGADIRLLTDVANLPEAHVALLSQMYGPRYLRPGIRSKFLRLRGDGPSWKVILAGYVLNALDRPDEVIRRGPHVPRPEDCWFPNLHDPSEPRPDAN